MLESENMTFNICRINEKESMEMKYQREGDRMRLKNYIKEFSVIIWKKANQDDCPRTGLQISDYSQKHVNTFAIQSW